MSQHTSPNNGDAARDPAQDSALVDLRALVNAPKMPTLSLSDVFTNDELAQYGAGPHPPSDLTLGISTGPPFAVAGFPAPSSSSSSSSQSTGPSSPVSSSSASHSTSPLQSHSSSSDEEESSILDRSKERSSTQGLSKTGAAKLDQSMFVALRQESGTTRAIKGGKRPPRGLPNPLIAKVPKTLDGRDKNVKELLKDSSKSQPGVLINPSTTTIVDQTLQESANFTSDIPGLTLPTYKDALAPYLLGSFYIFKNDCQLASWFVNSEGELTPGIEPSLDAITSMRDIFKAHRASPTPIIVQVVKKSLDDLLRAQSFEKAGSALSYVRKSHGATWDYKTQSNLIFRIPEPLAGVGYPCRSNLQHTLSLPRDRSWKLLSGTLEFLALEQAVEAVHQQNSNNSESVNPNSVFLPAVFVDNLIPPVLLQSLLSSTTVLLPKLSSAERFFALCQSQLLLPVEDQFTHESVARTLSDLKPDTL